MHTWSGRNAGMHSVGCYKATVGAVVQQSTNYTIKHFILPPSIEFSCKVTYYTHTLMKSLPSGATVNKDAMCLMLATRQWPTFIQPTTVNVSAEVYCVQRKVAYINTKLQKYKNITTLPRLLIVDRRYKFDSEK